MLVHMRGGWVGSSMWRLIPIGLGMRGGGLLWWVGSVAGRGVSPTRGTRGGRGVPVTQMLRVQVSRMAATVVMVGLMMLMGGVSPSASTRVLCSRVGLVVLLMMAVH